MISTSRTPCQEESASKRLLRYNDCPETRRGLVLTACVLISAMTFIDGSAVNVALPAIQAAFEASFAEIQWVVNAFALCLGSLLLIGGSAGDRFGRKRVVLLGTGLFVGGSVFSGIAPTAEWLVISRGVQGVGAALMVPNSLAILAASFPEAERGRAIGTWAAASAITAALGPVVGGFLVDALGWWAIFFLNLPIAVVAFVLAVRFIPRDRADESHQGVDVAGGLLAIVALGGLILGLIRSGVESLGSAGVMVPIGIGLAALIAFLVVEARSDKAMLPLRLFRSRAFSAANVITLLLYFALGGAFFFLPFTLKNVEGYTTSQIGLAFLPFMIVMATMSRLAGRLVERWGPRPILTVGPILAGGGFLGMMTVEPGGSYWVTYFPWMVLFSMGMAASVSPLTTTVMNSVEGRYTGAASGVNNAVSRVSNLLAVAVLGAAAVMLFQPAFDQKIQGVARASEHPELLAEARDSMAGVVLDESLPAPLRRELRQAINEAYLQSFRTILGIVGSLAIGGGLLALVMIGPMRRPDPTDGDATT